MFDVFSPLSQSAAWWLTVDASLRIMWNAAGIISLVAAALIGGMILRRLWKHAVADAEAKRAKAKAD